MALSTISKPEMESTAPGVASVPWSSLRSAGARVSVTNDDLPEPDTPVTATMQPIGISTSMSWRLFCLAPEIVTHLSFVGSTLSSGIGMLCLPDRYAPVRLSSLARSSS